MKQGTKQSYSSRELAERTGMSLKWVHKYIASRRLPGMYRAGSRWRFDRATVEKRILGGQLLLNKWS